MNLFSHPLTVSHCAGLALVNLFLGKTNKACLHSGPISGELTELGAKMVVDDKRDREKIMKHYLYPWTDLIVIQVIWRLCA